MCGARGRFFATTAPEAVAERQVQHLESAHGCDVVGWSARLADRAGLSEDLDDADDYDVLLTELKAAAVDVGVRAGAEPGAEVVFVDNRAVAVEGDTDLDTTLGWIVELAVQRGRDRGQTPVSKRGSKTPHILISDREQGLPYSKGLMASQVMVTGLSPVPRLPGGGGRRGPAAASSSDRP